MILVLLLGFVGMHRDMQLVRRTIYSHEIGEARSHLERTLGRIEADLREGTPVEAYQGNSIPQWLQDHWRRTIASQPDRLYAALVDRHGNVVSHSEDLGKEDPPARVLENDWNAKPLEGFGPRVFLIDRPNNSLSGTARAVDISDSARVRRRVVTTYHSGLDLQWLESQVWESQKKSIGGWGAILSAIGLVVLVSTVLLFRLGGEAKRLEQALEQAETDRLSGLSRLVVGMAHELRNPMNAVRLNLFTTEKVIKGNSQLSKDELIGMIHQSVQEVERMEGLIEHLLGYARTQSDQQASCDVGQQIECLLQFLKQSHMAHRITVKYTNAEPRAQAKIDGQKFRQVILNLLNNAAQAIDQDGTIEVRVGPKDGDLVIRVEDSGSGIPDGRYERIFEPFYSTKSNGMGLGLAIVSSIVTSAKGKVRCERSRSLGGMAFEVQLPRGTSNGEVQS
jgi:signal transduction histidine kinase